MYDVFSTCKLISYYKYTCDTISVSTCNGLLHAITRQGIETYTVRIYAAASDWIRENAAEDIQLDQHLVEEQSLTGNVADLEENLIKGKNAEEKSGRDLENKNADDSGCFHTETESIPDSASAGSTQSEESLQADAVHQEGDESAKQDSRSHSQAGLPSVACSTEGSPPMVVDSPEKNTIPPATDVALDSSSIKKETDSSPSDVKLTVDNSGRTLVRFTPGNKTPSPAESSKGVQSGEVQQNFDSESSVDLIASLRSRAFAVSNPLSRNNSTGARLSDAVYQAAVNKLSSDCGWTLPVFDLESLRQVGGLEVCIKQYSDLLLLRVKDSNNFGLLP